MNEDQAKTLKDLLVHDGALFALFEVIEREADEMALSVANKDLDDEEQLAVARAQANKRRGILHAIDRMKELIDDGTRNGTTSADD